MIDSIAQIRTRLTQRRFERRLEALLPDLYKLARGLVDEPADAEDLTHDVCVKAVMAAESVDLPNEAACRAWLRKIMINTFRDTYRRECSRAGIDYVALDTSMQFDKALMEYLLSRRHRF